MRRIAIVEYVMSAGGVERVLRGLARAFLAIPEARSWDITFLLSSYNSAYHRCEWPSELTGPNVRVEWLGDENAVSRALEPLAHGQGVLGWKATRLPCHAAAKLARSVGPLRWRAFLGDPYAQIAKASASFDLLYFTYPFWMGVPPMRPPVVTTPQDFNFKHFLGGGSLTRRIHERSTKAWLARSNRLLLSSHAVEDELRRFYPEHAAKARVVPLGIDVDHRPPSDELVESVRRERQLPPEFVLMSGWVVPHKNQLRLVEAIAALRERGTALPIVFVGPNTADLSDAQAPGLRRSPYVEQVRQALRRLGLRLGRDYFALGYVSDAEIQSLYRLATVFVSPSRYEGFGLPGLEATRAGCPVLLSTIPPFLEQNRMLGGILRMFDPNDPRTLADAIAAVLANREGAAAAARLASERVAAVYDWKKTARAYLSAFDELLSSTPRHRGA